MVTKIMGSGITDFWASFFVTIELAKKDYFRDTFGSDLICNKILKVGN